MHTLFKKVSLKRNILFTNNNNICCVSPSLLENTDNRARGADIIQVTIDIMNTKHVQQNFNNRPMYCTAILVVNGF